MSLPHVRGALSGAPIAAPDRRDAEIEPAIPRRTLVAIAASAVAMRLLVLGAAVALRHWGSADLVKLRDAESYIHVAQALVGRADVLTAFDRRVFIGYPALIATLGALRVPFVFAAMLVVWISVGVAAAGSAVLFRSTRVGWAMALLLPSWLMYSSIPMSEAPLLALTVLGLGLAVRGNPVAGGLLLGAAGLVRPQACFAVLGLFAWSVRRRRIRSGLVTGALSALVVGAGYGIYHLWSGDATQGVQAYEREYHGHIVDWPLYSLLHTPGLVGAPAWKVAYVWAYVALSIAAVVVLLRRAGATLPDEQPEAATERELSTLAAVWAIGNTLFALSVGHPWGFHEYHRFVLVALPALLWGLQALIPRRAPLLGALAAGSAALAVIGLTHGT